MPMSASPMSKQLGLEGTLTFTGRVNVIELCENDHVHGFDEPLGGSAPDGAGSGGCRPALCHHECGACREMLEAQADEHRPSDEVALSRTS